MFIRLSICILECIIIFWFFWAKVCMLQFNKFVSSCKSGTSTRAWEAETHQGQKRQGAKRRLRLARPRTTIIKLNMCGVSVHVSQCFPYICIFSSWYAFMILFLLFCASCCIPASSAAFEDARAEERAAAAAAWHAKDLNPVHVLGSKDIGQGSDPWNPE